MMQVTQGTYIDQQNCVPFIVIGHPAWLWSETLTLTSSPYLSAGRPLRSLWGADKGWPSAASGSTDCTPTAPPCGQ